MAIKNLIGFVQMAIIGNPNIDKETAMTLCVYVQDLKVCLDNQDSLVKALRADLDETRRNLCIFEATYLSFGEDGVPYHISVAHKIAKDYGWDCFKDTSTMRG